MRNAITGGLMAAATMIFLSSPTLAEDKPMQSWFGNTMIGCRSPGPDVAERECHEWFNSDGTLVLFMVKRENGAEIASGFREGKWYINDEGLMCRQMPPMQRPANAGPPPPNAPPPGSPICGGPGHRTAETNFYKPGKKWDDVNMSNKPEHFELIAGHH